MAKTLLHYQQVGTTGVPELEEVIEVSDDDVMPILNVTSEPGGKVKWKVPIVTGPTAGAMTWLGHIIKPSDIWSRGRSALSR